MITLMIFSIDILSLRGRVTFIYYTFLEDTLQTGLSDECFCEDFLIFLYSPSLIHHHKALQLRRSFGSLSQVQLELKHVSTKGTAFHPIW